MSQPAVNCEIVNMNEFQQVLNRALSLSSRTLPNGINSKMFYITRGASRNTPKANRAEIEKELGVVGYKVAVGKRGKPLTRNGKIRWNRVVSNSATLAAKIVNARLGRAGKKGLFGVDMKAAVEKLISKRVSSVGTAKAGWWNAIRIFGASVGEASFKEVSTYKLKGVSIAKTAKNGFTPEASVEYVVNSFDQSHRAYIEPRTRRALAQAYADEMRSMEQYILKKMQKEVVDKVSKP
jgi:hypothetical protein